MVKYKVILSDQVKKTLSRTNKKDKKMLLKAFKDLAKNPYAGHPWNPHFIKPWPNEKFCKYCGTKRIIRMDPNDGEVHSSCEGEEDNCTHSWMTKKEFITGRKGFLKEILKGPRKKNFKGLKPENIEFLD